MNDQEHKCQCDFRIRMLGDGCRYCQPQEYIDRLHDTMEDMVHTDCFELTDEEIKSLIPDTGAWWCEVGEDNVIDFAKAILRKAQEK